MRISDWSSDVCSSDLVRQGIRITVRVVGRFLRQFDGAFCSDERTGVRCPEAIADPDGPVYLARLSVAAYSGKRGSQIGRASCRENVCQSVSLSVVAGTLKTKSNQ